MVTIDDSIAALIGRPTHDVPYKVESYIIADWHPLTPPLTVSVDAREPLPQTVEKALNESRGERGR